MANVLPAERRLEVLAALVNGTSVRAAERMTGVHRDTIGRFAQAIGDGCTRLHDRLVRDLTSPLVDLDEQHSWVSRRQNKVDPASADAADVGEQWTWAAICRTSKLIIAWHVGKRDQESADALVEDVRARLVVMPQITTDGLALYAQPIAANFGPAVPYMQTVKNFSSRPGKPGVSEKYAVPRGVDFIQKRAVFGTPDPVKATNYAIERSNLTARQWNARLRRRTLAFSKKLSRHCAAVALHYVYTNLCHIPRTMRITPAMAAGVTDHVWTLEELMVAAMAEPAGEKPEPQPLTIQKPEGPARELPAGRGWLRVVDGGSTGATPSPKAPPPVPNAATVAPPLAPVPAAAPAMPATVAPAAPTAETLPQLDLFAWRPKPRAPVQLSLFGDPPAGPTKG
ncbi:hypothetical protein WME89_47500 [Sorangium sp. So ce321]|uniref:IS1 family transposase n=1 Tax=Sorangium sp. So ce321 TaxID=3133300 RepID=UPI003F613A1B